MRWNLAEPVTLSRWQVLSGNLSVMTLSLIILLDHLERTSPVRYILIAALAACLVALIILGLALLKPVSAKSNHPD
jgi:hypothetical protein